MAFNGEVLIYDGTPSDLFGLYIYNDNGSFDESVGESSELITGNVVRSPFRFLYGRGEIDILEFDISLVSKKPITRERRSEIYKWLVGRNGYKKLQIVQDDLNAIYFNAIFTEAKDIFHGNDMYGISVTAACDSPYAYEEPVKYTATSSVSAEIYNDSDIEDYIYPVIKITMASSGGDISIINGNENTRAFTFTGLSGGEVVAIDNRLKTIESSSGVRRLSAFNKNWFRLLPGVNTITVIGSGTVEITVPVIRRVSV